MANVTQLKHLEHLEDEMLNYGVEGCKAAVGFLQELRKMLGCDNSTGYMQTKWDGAPSIVCGKDPANGLFFVGTKSVFNKTEPKICYSHEDIDNYYQGELNDKLKKSFDHLSQLDIKGVIQGDLLYTETPPIVTMGGKVCYKFKPNTITYCVEKNTEMGKKVGHSDMGIVFHTRYSGPTIATMTAGFGVDVSGMQNNKLVAVFSSAFSNVNGIANLTPTELSSVKNDIRMAKTNLLRSKTFLNAIGGGTKPFSYAAMFKKYINILVRNNSIPASAEAMAKGYIYYVEKEFGKEIAKKKSEKGKETWKKQKQENLTYLNSNKSVIFSALTLSLIHI